MSRRLRRVGSTRTPDQQPCQWHLTPFPPCYSISSHSRRPCDASMDASRSFFTSASARDQCWPGVAPGPATLSIGASRSGRGLHFCGDRLSLTGLHATCRHLRSTVATLAANGCSYRTSISAWVEPVRPILNHRSQITLMYWLVEQGVCMCNIGSVMSNYMHWGRHTEACRKQRLLWF